MSRKVLGRGLSALINEDIVNRISGDEFLDLDIDLIEPNSEQPRSHFSEENLEELAQSIKINGIVQPIIVRRKGGKYQIVAGERRWRAAQKINLAKIPAIVKDVSDEKLLEIALIENIQRQELNAIEEAKAFKNLINSIGLTQEMIAERVGKSRTFITNSMRLLKLDESVQNLIIAEKISAGHARALLTLNDGETQSNIARKIIDTGLSVRETENLVKKLLRGEKDSVIKSKSPVKIDANVKAAESKLRRYLGTHVKIVPDGNGTSGKIEIEYYGETDLDRIYNLIMNISN